MVEISEHTDSVLWSLIYTHHEMIERLKRELEQLTQEAEKRKLL